MSDQSTGAMQNFQKLGGAPAASDPRPGLVVLYAEGHRALPSAFVLTKKEVVIGREDGVDLHLPVTAVSRRHATLIQERAEWTIRDLDSRNGTLLDGQKVDEIGVEHLAEVRIGDAILKFVDRGALAYQAYRIDGSMERGHPRLTQGETALVGGLQMDRIAAALQQISKTMLSVLLLGESGTGKEVAAREIHNQSGRPGPFVAVNCASLPENLIESELFGYKKGAFSGAERDKVGLVSGAHRGTLLLDEIGDMPLTAQAKLLRVLQSREVMPVGATKPESVDVRIIAATHRDLERAQTEGIFRRDLFARLNEFQVHLPPLRDRKEDILQLVQVLLVRHGRPDLVPSFPFMAGLLHHDWPYNVRELEGAIKRAIALSDGPLLLEKHLPESVHEAIVDYARSTDAVLRTEAPSREELLELLREEQGNVAAVGRRLGKARMQVHRYLKRYEIAVEDFR